MKKCLFCRLPEEAIIAENELAFAVYDKYPVNPGHTLIIPRRHYSSYFDVTEDELLAFHRLIGDVKRLLDAEFKPDGYNVGVNVGEPAGQVIWHVHLHVIPRFKGDSPRPGGLRRVKRPVTPWEREAEE
ncbi:MAG: HIT family protein [Ammonifex sp.]|nr:MAG: HIT family protein [Ammonifex sp.]